MALDVVQAAEVPRLDERWGELTRRVWPEYQLHGDVVSELWGGLVELFPGFQFVVLDEDGEIAARGFSIPCSWDGSVDGLPEGIDAVLQAGFELRERGEAANALSALAIAIRPEFQGRGLSYELIERMRMLAAAEGFASLLAPVRPTWKERYPLTPIERYVRWVRADGLPFDPWIRTHVRLHGEILRPAPRSLRITGTVAEWEDWTEMPFPETGA